jgi:hypothetical protein
MSPLKVTQSIPFTLVVGMDVVVWMVPMVPLDSDQ